MTQGRRLAAVLAADVAGFSALMGADEDGTFAALQALRRTTDTIITGHGGRIANTAGDSIVAEFPSVAEAVDAAVEIQRSPEVAASGIRLRIGVNLGDVIVTDDGDVFGDGVNVAARLEALAPDGGLVVSGAVRDSLRGRSPVVFEDLGLQWVKHIDEPVRVFRARLDEPAVPPPQPAATEVPHLLEREEELAVLGGAIADAADGRGRIVVIVGEAGIGKSSLARAAAAAAPHGVQVLWGWCDDLVTPRALGPFHDMASSLGPAVIRAIDEGGRPEAVLRALHEALADGTPRLLVVEDLHWADDATLDVLTFLGRRIQGLRCLVVATARDVAAARVRAALAEAPPGTVTRLLPAPLSAAAIAALVGNPTDAERLRRLTGGNPFFVSELAAEGTDDIPESVQDVVLARLARLSPPARRAAEAVSVGPTSFDVEVLDALGGDAASGLDEAERQGMLMVEGDRVRFRHELARRAVETSLTDGERRRLHLAALSALDGTRTDPARLVHHAAGAGDTGALVTHSLAAGDAAAALGAHREAVAHYQRVLDHEETLDAETLERVLEAHSLESYLLGRAAASSSRARLLEIHRARGDRLAEGDDLRWLSRLHWVGGDGPAAREAARRAVDILEPLGPSRQLAMALSSLSQLAMLAHERDEAVVMGERALEMAHLVGDEETAIHALTNIGTVVGTTDLESATPMLIDARDRAIATGLHEPACRAWVNMAWNLILGWRWDRARTELDDAIAFAVEHEIEVMADYMRAERAWIALDTGDWDTAMGHATDVARGLGSQTVAPIPALHVLGLLHARQGDLDEATRVAETAWGLATGTHEPQRIGPIAALLGEVAWLERREPDLAGVLRPAYQATVRVRYDRFSGDLSRWLRFAGEPISAEDHAEPYASEVQGRFVDAADQWRSLGVPYYEALARYEAGDRESAVRILEHLGASGTLRRVSKPEARGSSQIGSDI